MGFDRARLLRIGVMTLAIATTPSRATSQCADGTPTVNGRCRAARALPAIDRNRVAILPFRTTGLEPSQRHLGAGIAELLAAEFNGETGPIAVESVEANRAWKRAGGENGPLTRQVALQTATALGAGQLIEGSIVQIGTTFRITASMLRVPDGATEGSPVKVEETEERLNAVPAALATQILGTKVGITASVPWEAQRAYLTGMELYRKNAAGADSQFLRAIRIDSTFIHPVYRMVLMNAIRGPQVLGIRDYRPAFRMLWSRRQQLSPEQRTLFDAVADSNGLRLRVGTLPRLERAMPALQNSAEAWEILANGYYNTGALLGREDWLEQARRAYLRVVQIDPTIRARAYPRLADLAYVEGDARAFARYSLGTPWERYEAALLARNSVAIRSARAGYAREAAATYLRDGITPFWLTGSHLSAGEVDSLLRHVEPLAISDEQRRTLAFWELTSAIYRGRPAQVSTLARRIGVGTSAASVRMIDVAADDSAFVETSLTSIERTSPNYRIIACESGLSRLRRADTTGVAAILGEIDPSPMTSSEILAREPRGDPGLRILCPQVLRGVLESFQPAGVSFLLRADSLMRQLWFNLGDMYNYDLALAFARRGEYGMAASAARRHARWISGWSVPRWVISLRHEGRWAALAGDTASAIKAYDDYLKWRYDPEPVLVPQRDSVRAERAALVARGRATQRKP